MADAIPHERIREGQDRSWTRRLVQIVGTPSTAEEEREAAFNTLDALGDYRSVTPLTQLIEDLSVDEDVRERAADVLFRIDDTTTASTRRAWWASGDRVLKQHALDVMRRSEADIVVPVASDDQHPLQDYALQSMAHGFNEAAYAPVLIRALSHPDPDVRWAAADALLWAEPVAAEEPLIGLLQDPDEDVVRAAIDTLAYYASRRTLRALHDFAGSADGDLAECAQHAYDRLLNDFSPFWFTRTEVRGGRELMRPWLEPVADLVAWPTTLPDSASGPSPSRVKPTPPRLAKMPSPPRLAEMRALLSEPDGEWAERKAVWRTIDWTTYGAEERAELRPLLLHHPDPDVRDWAAIVFAAWDDSAALLRLGTDVSHGVRKAALYSLSLVSADPAIAAFAWDALAVSSGTAASEALETYRLHAPADEARARLETLARDDHRSDVRAHAVHGLEELGAAGEIQRLVPLLDETPDVTWALHTWLLSAIGTLGLPTPDLERLAAIDNFHLHRSVVDLQCRDLGD